MISLTVTSSPDILVRLLLHCSSCVSYLIVLPWRSLPAAYRYSVPRPTMTTRRTATMAITTTTTMRLHLIKFALYRSAHCGKRSLSNFRERYDDGLWTGALIRNDLLEQMNERFSFAFEDSLLTRSRSLSAADVLPSDSKGTLCCGEIFPLPYMKTLISIIHGHDN